MGHVKGYGAEGKMDTKNESPKTEPKCRKRLLPLQGEEKGGGVTTSAMTQDKKIVNSSLTSKNCSFGYTPTLPSP
jgi:hypothetical protein